MVVEAHKLYLSAGAQSITTSNYAVQPNYFTLEYGNNFDWSLISKYATIAGKLASQARDESGRKDASTNRKSQIYGIAGVQQAQKLSGH